MTPSSVGTLPSCMYGAVSAMLRSVGARKRPMSAGACGLVHQAVIVRRIRALAVQVVEAGVGEAQDRRAGAELNVTGPERLKPAWQPLQPTRSEKNSFMPADRRFG